MKRLLKKAAFFMVFTMTAASPLYGVTARASEETAAYQETKEDPLFENIDKTIKGLRKISGKQEILSADELFTAGKPIGDWTAMAMAYSGRDDDFKGYLKALEDFVSGSMAEKGMIKDGRATEYQRIALTINALGGDPSAFGKDENGTPFDMVALGTFGYAEGSPSAQGVNAVIYALLIMDAVGTEIPDSSPVSREALVEKLMACQRESGGFSLSESVPENPEITAMALQAIAPYTEDEKVQASVDMGLSYLSASQKESGGFDTYGEEDLESTAQVIMALSALGIDPEKEDAFIKNGNSLLDALEGFRMEDGTFCHVRSKGTTDLMSTESALIAMESVAIRRTDDTWIFQSDIRGTRGESETSQGPFSILWGAAAAAVITFFYISVRRTS